MPTKIEWTNETWNVSTGCDQVSPGCDNCYALTMAARLKAMGQAKYQRDGDPRTSGPGFGLTEHPDTLDQPLRWRKPRRVFVNSMSDLFHPKVSDGFIGSVWRTMALGRQHTYQILTKRPARMRSLLTKWGEEGAWRDHRRLWNESRSWPLPNVWLGVSVEDQQRADERIPPLLDTPAAVRFVSAEPLLGPVTLRDDWIELELKPFGGNGAAAFPRIDWCIVGGESGPGARPMHPQWVRRLRDQCDDAGVAFFFKQWGAWVAVPPSKARSGDVAVSLDGSSRRLGADLFAPLSTHERRHAYVMRRVGKKDTGRELDGRTWDQFPDAAVSQEALL